jgi:hypothetical protein
VELHKDSSFALVLGMIFEELITLSFDCSDHLPQLPGL